MYKSIKNIWQGKFVPNLKFCINGDEILNFQQKSTHIEKEIQAILPNEHKKLLETLLDNHLTLIDLLQEEAFVKGFRMGAQLTKEALE